MTRRERRGKRDGADALVIFDILLVLGVVAVMMHAYMSSGLRRSTSSGRRGPVNSVSRPPQRSLHCRRVPTAFSRCNIWPPSCCLTRS